MSDIRDSFSKLKKKLKRPLKGSSRRPETVEADDVGEGVDSTSSLPRPEPHIVAGGDDDPEESGANGRDGVEQVPRSSPTPSEKPDTT
jgi:hypothetical protein